MEWPRLFVLLHGRAELVVIFLDQIDVALAGGWRRGRLQCVVELFQRLFLVIGGNRFIRFDCRDLLLDHRFDTDIFLRLRIDVAEELSRLRSHIAELNHILQDQDAGGHAKTRKGSAGKRLDFLFQEMNREANTLGSKAAALSVTRAAIDLKLLIEQMREQAQNLE